MIYNGCIIFHQGEYIIIDLVISLWNTWMVLPRCVFINNAVMNIFQHITDLIAYSSFHYLSSYDMPTMTMDTFQRIYYI